MGAPLFYVHLLAKHGNFFIFAVHLWQFLCQFGGWLGWIYGVFGEGTAAAIFGNPQIQYIFNH